MLMGLAEFFAPRYKLITLSRVACMPIYCYKAQAQLDIWNVVNPYVQRIQNMYIHTYGNGKGVTESLRPSYGRSKLTLV